jgi:protein gp37
VEPRRHRGRQASTRVLRFDGDVFEKRGELDAWRAKLWPLIEATPALDWLLLTKRPESVRKMVPWGDTWPANVWLGTTAENQLWASKRLPHLVASAARVKFVSAEPLLGALDLRAWLARSDQPRGGVNWVIAGGESGPHARPMNPAWAEDLRDQCVTAGTAFHFKQWGHWGPENDGAGAKSPRSIQLTRRDGSIVTLFRLGKHATGRELGGRTWDGLPRPI